MTNNYNDGEILGYIKTGVNVNNGIFQVTSASKRVAFATSIRQMVAPLCINCKCSG